MRSLVRGAHLCLVALAALGAGVGPLVRVHAPVPLDVGYGLVELATLPAAEPPLVHVHLLVLLQQVALGELLATLLALERFVLCVTLAVSFQGSSFIEGFITVRANVTFVPVGSFCRCLLERKWENCFSFFRHT